MNRSIKTLILCLIPSLLAGCTPTQVKWQANIFEDEFTDVKICRVEHGDEYGRGFLRSLAGQYYTYNFYAENIDGEIRAGIRSEPQIPIAGDVQIKVGDRLFTLTSADTPLDVAPIVPIANEEKLGKAYADTMKAIAKTVQQAQSPYRAYTGKKAKELLRAMIKTNEEIKFRTIGVNSALSATGKFKVDDDFKAALKECNIL